MSHSRSAAPAAELCRSAAEGVRVGDWVTVYDIRETVPWKLALFTLFGVALTIACVRHVVGSVRHREWGPAGAALFGLALAFGLGVVGTGTVWYGQYVLRRAAAGGEAEVVVGPVVDFTARRLKGRWIESFRVDGAAFDIDPARAGGGLERPANDGGPCRSGRVVRISYRRSVILRVEVQD